MGKFPALKELRKNRRWMKVDGNSELKRLKKVINVTGERKAGMEIIALGRGCPYRSH